MILNQIPLFETDATNYLVKSPLNYVGGKFRLLNQMYDRESRSVDGEIVERSRLIPANIRTFVDAFCGGFNVGANAAASTIVGIDLDRDVIDILSWIRETPTLEALHCIWQIITRYQLGVSRDTDGTAMGKTSTRRRGALASVPDSSAAELETQEPSDGHDPYETSYYALRTTYNRARMRGKRKLDGFDMRAILVVLIAHGWRGNIRFSTRGFNVPYGWRTFNDRQARNFTEFSRRLRIGNASFQLGPFSDVEAWDLGEHDYVYLDPPYLISTAPYNENLCWEEEDDRELYAMLDRLHRRGVRFGVSNVLEHKGNRNEILAAWATNYNMRVLDFNYARAAHPRNKDTSATTEVFVTNCIV
jgi:site-specific DNA-adenine methylase